MASRWHALVQLCGVFSVDIGAFLPKVASNWRITIHAFVCARYVLFLSAEISKGRDIYI